MKKNRQLLIIIGVAAAFLLPSLFLLFLAFSHSTKKSGTEPFPQIQPTRMQSNIQPTQTSNANTITGNSDITKVQPQNLSNGISLNEPIIMTFTKAISENNIHVTSDPAAVFSVNTQGNTVTLTPTTSLAQATLYTLTIVYDPQSPAYIYSFRTIGAATDTFDFPHQRADADTIQNAPDVYLANRVPYKTTTFSVDAALSQATGTDVFTVLLTGANKQQAKQDFITWVKSQGLTDQQIQSLIINYN